MRLSPLARCRFTVPDTFADYCAQSRRIRAGERQLEREYALRPIEKREFVRAIARSGSKDPLGAVCWAAMYAASLVVQPERAPADETIIRSTKGAVDALAASERAAAVR